MYLYKMEGYVSTKWLFPHPFHRETYKGDWKNTWNTISSTKRACGFTDWTDLPRKARQKTGGNLDRIDNWLVVEPTPLKNIRKNGNLPQIGVKIKHIWNHHLRTKYDSHWINMNMNQWIYSKWTCHGVNFWQVQGMCQLRVRDEHWIMNIVFSVLSCPVRTSCMEIAVFRKDSCRVRVVLQPQAPPMP